MTAVLKNKFLTVTIDELGAELTSVKSNDDQIEYIWQADPQVWGRHAPVLFPFVGRLKDDQFKVNGKRYPMGQHGFARDIRFTVISASDDQVVMELKSTAETREKFPFDFELRLHFELQDHELTERYEVRNPTAEDDLWFAIGGHPGFNLNLGDPRIGMAESQMRIAPKQVFKQIPLQAPYTDPKHLQDLDATQPLALSHELFANDALILDLQQRSTTVMLENDVNDHGVALTVADAPYLGIWSPYPAEGEFICLEPWWGIADTVDFNGELNEKLGMNRLAAGATFNHEFTISFF